jgi:hypothetical protein
VSFTDDLRYFLTLTSFQPLYGKLSDIFGLGCLFCGLARNLWELVAARAFAGEYLFPWKHTDMKKADPCRNRWRRDDYLG